MTKSFEEIVSNYQDPAPEWTVLINGKDYSNSLDLLEFTDSVNNPLKFTVKLSGVDSSDNIPEDSEVVVKRAGGELFRGVLKQVEPNILNTYTFQGTGYAAELEADSEQIVSDNSGISAIQNGKFEGTDIQTIVDTLVDASSAPNTRQFSTSYSGGVATETVGDFRAKKKQLDDVNRLMGEYDVEWYTTYDSNNNPVFNVVDQINNTKRDTGILEGFEDDSDGVTPDGWTGDTGFFEADTSNPLSGSVSAIFTGTSNSTGRVRGPSQGDLQKNASFKVKPVQNNGLSFSNYLTIGLNDSSDTTVATLEFRWGGATSNSGDDRSIEYWDGSTQHVLDSFNDEGVYDCDLRFDYGADEVEIIINGSSKGVFSMPNAVSGIDYYDLFFNSTYDSSTDVNNTAFDDLELYGEDTLNTLTTYGSEQSAEKVSQNANRNKGDFDGVLVRGYGDGEDQITATAGSTGKGNRILIYTDKTIVSKSQAQKRADNINDTNTVSWQEIEVKPSDPNKIYGVGDELKVEAEEARLNDTYRVVESYFKFWPEEDEVESKLNLSNKPQTFVDDFKEQEDKSDSQTDYMQGARNVWSDKETANATNPEPLTIDFEVPPDVVDVADNNRLSRVEFNYACVPYKQSSDTSSVTASNFDPGVKVDVGTDVGASDIEMERSNISRHRHAVGSSTSRGAQSAQKFNTILFSDQTISGWTNLGGTDIEVGNPEKDLEHVVNVRITDITDTSGNSISGGKDLHFAVQAETESSLNPDFSYNPSSPAVGETVEFIDNTDTDAPPFAWHWRIEEVDGSRSFPGNAVASGYGDTIQHVFAESGDYDVTLTVNGLREGPVQEADAANDQFTIVGDETTNLQDGDAVRIIRSDGNNGVYQIQSYSYNSTDDITTITVVESVDYGYTSGEGRGVLQLKEAPVDGADTGTESVTKTVSVLSPSGLTAEELSEITEKDLGPGEVTEEDVSDVALKLDDRTDYDVSPQISAAISSVDTSEDVFYTDDFLPSEVGGSAEAVGEYRFTVDSGVHQGEWTYRQTATPLSDGVKVQEDITDSTAEGNMLLDSISNNQPSSGNAVLINNSPSINVEGSMNVEHQGTLNVVLERHHPFEVALGSLLKELQGTASYASDEGFPSHSFSKSFTSGELGTSVDGPGTYRTFGRYEHPTSGYWIERDETGPSFNAYEFYPTMYSASQTLNTQDFELKFYSEPIGPIESVVDGDNFIKDLGSGERLRIKHEKPDGSTSTSVANTNLQSWDRSEGNSFSFRNSTVTLQSVDDGSTVTVDVDGTDKTVSEGEYFAVDTQYVKVDRVENNVYTSAAFTSTVSSPNDPSRKSFTGLSDGDHKFTIEADVVDTLNGDTTVSSKTITITVDLNDPPSADFSYSPSNPSVDDNVYFTDESTDPDGDDTIVQWDWDFGDGTTETITSAPGDTSHKYSSAGDYNVSLTVTDSSGATDTITKTVSVGSGISSLNTPITRSYESVNNVGGAPTGTQNLDTQATTSLNNPITRAYESVSRVGAQESPGVKTVYADIALDVRRREVSDKYEVAAVAADGTDIELSGEVNLIKKNHIHDIPRQEDFDDKAAGVGAGAEDKEVPYTRAQDDKGDVLLDFSTNNEAITLDTNSNGNEVTITVGNIDDDGDITNTEQITANNGSNTTTNTYQDSELYLSIDKATDKKSFEVRDQSLDDVYTLAAAPEERFRSAKTDQKTENLSGEGSQQNVLEGISDNLIAGSQAENVRIFIDDDPDDDTTNTEEEITGDFYNNDTDGDGHIDSGTPKDKELDLTSHVDDPGWYQLKIVPDQASFIKSRVFLDHHKDTE